MKTRASGLQLIVRGRSARPFAAEAPAHADRWCDDPRDPDNANLDRIQVIKGWLDTDGKTHERIYDVVCADGRTIKKRRWERPVGSTVDVTDASYTNTIGDPLLTAHWIDPDFDPNQRAFYYVRVLEIPKPRWSAYDQKRFGIQMPADVPMTVQDRAYTSPIWYTPKG